MRGNNHTLARSIRGPVTLITVGALFALNNFTSYRFSETWPVLLIVFGLMTLLGRGMEAPPPPPPQQQVYYPPTPPPGPGTYRQTPYPGTPPTASPGPAARGGFGTSAPRDPETNTGENL